MIKSGAKVSQAHRASAACSDAILGGLVAFGVVEVFA
jgi:hypothetical protein